MAARLRRDGFAISFRASRRAASGEAIDTEALTRVSNAQTRVLRTLQRGRATPRS